MNDIPAVCFTPLVRIHSKEFKSMKILRAALITLSLALIALPVQAASLNKDDANKLKTVLDTYLREQIAIMGIDGVTKLETQGETTVEMADTYYAATLPYLKVAYPDGSHTDIGMISINALPGDSPGQWKMRVAIPSPIVVTDKGGTELGRVTISGQRAAGIWDETMQNFVKLDALYKDIAFAGSEGSFKIPETKILYDFKPDAAGKWSGPGTIEASNIQTTDGTLRIEKVKADFSIDQYSAVALKDYRQKIADLSKSMVTKPSAEISTAFGNTMLDFLTTAGNGMMARYEILGFHLAKPASGNDPAINVDIPKGFFAAELGNLLAGKARFTMQGGFNDLKISPEPPGSEGLIPTSSSVNIALDNVPLRDITTLLRNTMESAIKQPEMQQLAGVSLMVKLPALLSQAGTTLSITETHTGNAEYDVKIEGKAKADFNAVNSATADATATFRNLDSLLTKLKAQEKNPQTKDPKGIQNVIAQLEWIKQVAKTEKSANGQTLHIIDFTMNPQGQMLLNGQDMMAMKGQSAPAPAP